jgi:biopolymer transport protein ExbD
MKLKAGQKVHYEAGPNMTPLVDIVMVILIFLMLTGTFALGEHFLQSNVPIRESGNPDATVTEAPRELDEPLEIRVSSFKLGNQEMWQASAGHLRVQNSRESLARQLTLMHERMNAANTPTDKIQVVISPTSTTKYKHLVIVYEAALDAKFAKIAFSTAQK